MARILRFTAALLIMVTFALVFTAANAHAATTTRRDRALDWAESHAAGCWYSYGGAGPCAYGYDCSGLVQAAYAHVGVSLPRTTYEMAVSSELVRIPLSQAKRGDIIFYGWGHVELKTNSYHGTFGAHDWGTRVGWTHWNSWWPATAAFRLRY